MLYFICFVIGCATPSWKWCWRITAGVLLTWTALLAVVALTALASLGDKGDPALLAYLAGGHLVSLGSAAIAAAAGHGLRLLLRPPAAYERERSDTVARVFDGEKSTPAPDPKS